MPIFGTRNASQKYCKPIQKLKKIAVFASGSGSNFQAIIDAATQGNLPAQLCGLVASRESIGALQRAAQHNIPSAIISRKHFTNESDFAQALLMQLELWGADIIVLAGYLTKIPPQVIAKYRGRILNIHPSLLPKYGGQGFFGRHVHEAVIANQESISGCTVHIVDEEFDRGPILAQAEVPVYPDDTPELLAARILKEEHRIYPKTITEFLT